MKAQLNKGGLSKKKLSKNNRDFKKDKSKKPQKNVYSYTGDDSELERKLQSEVKLFLNSEFENKKIGKTKNKKQKNIDDNSNDINGHKLLNQNKYDAKMLKKSKLKQNNLNKLEKKKKKRITLVENDANKESNATSIEHSILSPGGEMFVKVDRTPNGKKNRIDDNTIKSTVQGKIQKRNGKKLKDSKMKKLFKKFDKMNIEQETPRESKKIQKNIESTNSQENIDSINDLRDKKKNKNKAKKLRKKEKLLRQLLKEKEGNKTSENTHTVGNEKSRPSITTVTSQIKRLKSEIPESKRIKRKKRSNAGTLSDEKEVKITMSTDDVEMKQVDTEISQDIKKKKKKKSQINYKNNDSAIKKSKLVNSEDVFETQESVREGYEVPNVLGSHSSGGGHKKEKCFNSKHTPLREKLMNKLKAARFRYLNEQLYTSKSGESKDFFLQDPESFEAYHEGFKKQVSQWPINPVNVIIKSIQERESRRHLVIADLGCGEAQLAAALGEHKVHSLDLVALNDRVTPCDMTHTHLKSDSVDVAVFCLSLMGTDLSACVKEANRILKLGGEMKIAEVESRFHDVKDFIKDIQKYGFEKTNLNMDYSIFFFIDFKKVSNLSKSKKKKLPVINLKPCLYKKR